jgi:hypothetical protein
LRKNILAGMLRQGISRREAEEALDVDVRDLQINIRRSLGQESLATAFSEKKDALHFQQKIAPRAKS